MEHGRKSLDIHIFRSRGALVQSDGHLHTASEMSEAICLASQVEVASAHTDAPDCGDSTLANTSEIAAPQREHAFIRISGVPRRLDETMLSGEISETRPDQRPEIAILNETNAGALLARRLSPGVAAIIPVVDATCRGRGTADHRRSDMAIDRAARFEIEEAVQALHPIVRRVRSLPRAIMETDDPRLMLLARLFVRDRALTPRSEVRARTTFVYDDEAVIPGAARFAEELTALGLMERKFVDKTTVCPHCASARMTVREHCSRCGVANIVEEPIVHHMKCGQQGPERDFRRGLDLVCPKCLQQLKNFSVDYDRPGSIGVCLSCGHLSTEHRVGFLCLDCGSRVEARDADNKTIYAYDLTAAGRACVSGGAPLPEARDFSVGARIGAFVRRHAAIGRPCSILFARLGKPPEMPHSGDAWRQTCAFFGQIMRECFVPETEIVEASPVFLALLANDRKAEVERYLPQIRERLERHLALAPVLQLAVFSPDEVPGIAGRQEKIA